VTAMGCRCLTACATGARTGGSFCTPSTCSRLNGQDMPRQPLEVRKRALAAVLLSKSGADIQLNEHCDDLPADVVFRHACKLGFEGIVSKRLGSPYRSGRSRDWLKVKNPNAPAVKREAEEDWGRDNGGSAPAGQSLLLKRAALSRPSGEWNDDDYDVLADGEVVGHIFNAAASPVGTYSVKAPASEVFRSAPVRGEYLGASCSATRAAASSRSMKISANIGGTPTQHNSRHYTRSAAAVGTELATVDAGLRAP
jgi:ATP dependent DNA ligase domain